MAINIKDPEVDALVRRLAARTGESITETIAQAVRERLARSDSVARPDLQGELAAIRRRCAKLKQRDGRSADAIVGYNSDGAPE
jgi:antitoxin VapB